MTAPFVAALFGTLLTVLAAAVLGMSLEESAQLAGLACLASMIAGVVGVLALNLVQRSSLGAQIIVVALTAIAAVAAGAATAASWMFISAHDLRTLSVVLTAAATVGSVVALALGRRVSSVGHWLEVTTHRISDGDAPGPLPRPAPGEFARLAHALAEMSRRLDHASAAERALDASRRELVAWVSHDLRTPLAGIRAMAEALEDEVVDDPDTRARYHRAIRIEADRLAGLVDDLFELSRINAGALRLEMERVSLGDLVSDALSAAAGVARSEGVALDGRLEADTPALDVSAPDMARVIRNLLENAIKHTPSDGVVRVEIGADDRNAYIIVADSCGGIPAQDIDRVFDVAFRGETARTPGVNGGGGLGLAIARGLVEAHRGEIDVSNEGAGCRFTVRLPLDRSPGGAIQR